MAATKIEWTNRSWNPVVGCSHASPGCFNCYAETMAGRHVLMQAARGKRSPYLRVVDAHERRWTRPIDAKRNPDTHRPHREKVRCFGTTDGGAPKHPLRLAADLMPQPFDPEVC